VKTLSDLFSERENRAVSPLVSTMLMVALAILLSATIGIAVFTIVSDVDPGPTASFEAEYTIESGHLTVTLYHTNGDTLQKDKLTVLGSQSGQLSLTSQDEFSAGERLLKDAPVRPVALS
jgi:FlaG/FlaF family flagellin (archaellin)